VAALFLGHIRIVIGPTPLIVSHRYDDPDPDPQDLHHFVADNCLTWYESNAASSEITFSHRIIMLENFFAKNYKHVNNNKRNIDRLPD